MPVIVLHGYKKDRHDFDELATALQARGHWVIAPDLRGHGESTQITRPGETATDKIDDETLKPADVKDMFARYGDLEAVKSYLIQKNNAEELNIDKLCVIGSDMGAVVAINWALLDWSWPVLSNGKQGQDVKALVLISPESNSKGVRTVDAINDQTIRTNLAILLIAGRKGGHYADEVNKLYRHFSKYHQEKTSPPLEKLLPETKLQGGAAGREIARGRRGDHQVRQPVGRKAAPLGRARGGARLVAARCQAMALAFRLGQRLTEIPARSSRARRHTHEPGPLAPLGPSSVSSFASNLSPRAAGRTPPARAQIHQRLARSGECGWPEESKALWTEPMEI